MKRLLKILGIIIGIFILLTIIGYIAISSFLTPAYLRSVVERMASEAINYPVEIGGVSLKLGMKISIGIDRLSLKNPEGFSNRKMVDIKEIKLNLKLLPLFKRQIVVSSITIDDAEINIERNKENHYNIAVPRLQRYEGPNYSISVDWISITRSNLNYRDEITKIELDVKDFNQKITLNKNLISISGNQRLEYTESKMMPALSLKINNMLEYDTLTRNINLKELKIEYGNVYGVLSGVIEKSELLNIDANLTIPQLEKFVDFIPEKSRPERLSGSIRLDAKVLGTTKEPKLNGKCELVNIEFKLKELNQPVQKINGSFAFDLNSIKNIIIQGIVGTSKFDISGSVNNLKRPVLDLIIKVMVNLKDIETLSAQTSGMKLSGNAGINISIKGYAEKPSYFGEYTITDGVIDGIGLVKPISNLRVRGTFQRDGAKIAECSGHIGRSDFSLSGYVTNFQKPVLQINNVSNLIDLDELFPKTKEVKKTEQKGIPVTIEGNIKINRLTGMDMEFKNINTSFKYENGIIDLKNCTAETFDGKVQLDFYYNINSPEPYRIHSRMENINVQKILKRFLKFENLTGRLSGVNNFQGMGFQQHQVIANLTASGNVKLVNGSFNNFEFFNKLCEWLGFRDRKTILLKDLAVSFKIENGRTNIEDWSMDTEIGKFLVNGFIKLDGFINLNLTLTLNKRESDMLKNVHGDWLLYYDPQGRATVDIIATGKLLSPHFRLDTDKIKERLKGKIKDEYDKKKKELEKKLKDLFKK
ncbi:MAG: AsmA family protein [candidate division WOR-3 bacterium]|nr:AsmA family protein [candidate division WOR-3 bacterium]